MDERSTKRRRISPEIDAVSQQASESPAASSPTTRRQSAAAAAAAAASRRPVTTTRVAASELGETEDTAERNQVEAPTDPASTNTRDRTRLSRGASAAVAAQSPRPNPRPFPPPAPDGEDDMQPFIGRTSRRSPVTGISVSRTTEPVLPQGLSDNITSTPPKGIHSSPSRWRGGTRRTPKSSPLKQPPLRPEGETTRRISDSPLRRQRTASRPPLVQQDENAGLQLHPSVDPLRKIPNGDQDKKRERDELQKELTQLQADLELATRESARLLLMQTTGRNIATQNEKAILDLLRRCLVPADLLAQPPQSQQLVMAALNPMGLLPFSKLPSAQATQVELESLKNIKSHHPVAMTAEEELPYLRMFSAFDMTSSIASLPRTAEHPFRQRRLITLRSRQTPPLFQSRVEMIVNPMTLAILELKVSALEPAAKQELGPFIEKICNGRCNRSMQRNVGILTWAMGEWQRVASRRATTWSRLAAELATKDEFYQTVAGLRTKRRRQDHDAENARRKARRVGNVDLMRFLGQQSFDIAIDPDGEGDESSTPQLRLEWKISFDWTGEARNHLAVLIGVPGKCKFNLNYHIYVLNTNSG